MLPLMAATSFEHRGPQCLLTLGRSTSPPLDQLHVLMCSCPLCIINRLWIHWRCICRVNPPWIRVAAWAENLQQQQHAVQVPETGKTKGGSVIDRSIDGLTHPRPKSPPQRMGFNPGTWVRAKQSWCSWPRVGPCPRQAFTFQTHLGLTRYTYIHIYIYI